MRRSAGFTLIEVIVVLIIIGIAAAAVVPQFSSGASFQASSAARMVAVDLQFAQNQAIASQKRVRVSFNPVTDSYQLLYWNPATSTSSPVLHPINKGNYAVSFKSMKEFASLDLVSATFGTKSYVEFDPIGAPDHPGTVVMRVGVHTYTISVTAITGKISVTAN